MSRWTCNRCTFINRTGTVTCAACGAFHPLEDPTCAAGWPCPACTFVNDDSAGDRCIICAASRSVSKPKKPGWPCKACTFMNAGDHVTCAICGVREDGQVRSNPVPPPRPSPSTKPTSSAFQTMAASAPQGPGSGDVFIAPLDVDTYIHLPQHETPKAAYPLALRSKRHNRYVDVLPNPVTRVRLRVLDPSDPASDYINANFIRGFGADASVRGYIAAQGPLPTSLESFVRMIWEQQCGIIIMATGLVEKGKTKCEQYWPSSGSRRFGEVSVTLKSTKKMSGYVRQALEFKSKSGGKPLSVTHFWYNTWPDHGVPKDQDGRVDPTNLLTMMRDVRGLRMTLQIQAPLLVHCSAGIGRTGVVIAVDQALDAIDKKLPFDLNELIVNDRQDRMCLVQHSSQYKFAHQALLKYAEETVVRRKTGSVYAFTRGAQRRSIKRDPSWKPVESKEATPGRRNSLFALTTGALAPLAEDEGDKEEFDEDKEAKAADPPPSEPLPLHQQPWFRSGLSRPQVEQVLAGTGAGTFVVRNSARSGYALSIQRGDGYVTHMLIVGKKKEGGPEMYQLGKLGSYQFDSIEKLLRHYRTKPYSKHTVTGAELFLTDF